MSGGGGGKFPVTAVRRRDGLRRDWRVGDYTAPRTLSITSLHASRPSVPLMLSLPASTIHPFPSSAGRPAAAAVSGIAAELSNLCL